GGRRRGRDPGRRAAPGRRAGSGRGHGGRRPRADDSGGRWGRMSEAVSEELLAGLEAVLMVTDQPVTAEQLAEGLGVEADEVAAALTELAADYDGQRGNRPRGFRLSRAAGGWRIYSRPEHHDIVSAFLTAGHSAKLSQAALETLAVVAYRQPVTRARISAIRGVNVD